MIEYSKIEDSEYVCGFGEMAIFFDEEDKSRILQVLKRGTNTQSPPDLDIINLIQEMERE